MTKGILKGPALLITTNHKVKPPTNEGKSGRASLKTPAVDGRKTSFIYANSPGLSGKLPDTALISCSPVRVTKSLG